MNITPRILLVLALVIQPGLVAAAENHRDPIYKDTVFYEEGGEVCASGTSVDIDTTGFPAYAVDVIKAQKANIEQLQNDYMKVGKKKQMPWQLLAAVHYREGGNNPDVSPLAGEPFGTPNPDHPEITVDDMQEGLEYAADYLRGLAKASYGVDIKDNNSFEELQKIFLSYNRGVLYKNAGVSPDRSPYVMNYFDKDHMDMHWVDGVDTVSGANSAVGAMVIFMAYGGKAKDGTGNQGCESGSIGVGKDGFVFPLKTTKAEVQEGAWCFSSKTSCHGQYKAADIFMPVGTKVIAATPGTVHWVHQYDVCVGYDVPKVKIRGTDGYYYYYTHMAVGSVIVQDGQKIKAGDLLGEVGPSDCAQGTTPHLHFDIAKEDIAVSRKGVIEGTGDDREEIKLLIDPQPLLISAYNELEKE